MVPRYTCEKLPTPSPNGGWYTGENFKEGAEWASVPIIPNTEFMIHHNLRSANPPPGALTQYPGGPRHGNNCQSMPNTFYIPRYNIACNQPIKVDEPSIRFAKYAYI